MFNSIYLYRIARYLYLKRIPFIPWLIEKIIFLMYNSIVPKTAIIGKNTELVVGGVAVIIHPRSVIGNNVRIGASVTIGGKYPSPNVPVIGDNVYISTGARILGDVKIGNNAIVGANAVVLEDVPENAVVVGIPAKVIKFRASEDKRYGE